MTVLFVVHQYLPDFPAGTEYYTHWLAKGLAEEGHQVRVWTFRDVPGNRFHDFGVSRREYDGIPVAELRFNLALAAEGAEREWRGDFQCSFLQRELHREQPDLVIVTHALKHSTAVFETCRRHGIPAIALLTDFWALCPLHTLWRVDGQICDGPEPNWCTRCVTQRFPGFYGTNEEQIKAKMARRPDAMRENFEKARHIVVLTRLVRSLLEEHGYPPEKLVLIENGPRIEDWEQPEMETVEPDDPPSVLFVGPSAPWKGANILAEALSYLPETPRIQVRMIMTPNKSQDYIQLQEVAHRHPRLRLEDPVPHRQIWKEIQKCSAVAVPSQWHESGTMVAKSAILCGAPLLMSDLPGLRELQEYNEADQAHIRFVKPDDAKAWADAMAAVIQERQGATPRPVQLFPERAPIFSRNLSEWLRLVEQVTGKG